MCHLSNVIQIKCIRNFVSVKAGGKRIIQHKHEKPAEMTQEEVEEFGPPE
jgi:hypothetical protein